MEHAKLVCLADVKPSHKLIPMSEQRITEIEDRVKAATPGRWIAFSGPPELNTLGDPICWMAGYELLAVCRANKTMPTNNPFEDAAFIYNARQDVPDLLAEVRRLQSQVDLAFRQCHTCGEMLDKELAKP